VARVDVYHSLLAARSLLMAERPHPDAIFKPLKSNAGRRCTTALRVATPGILRVAPICPPRQHVALRLVLLCRRALPRRDCERFTHHPHFAARIMMGSAPPRCCTSHLQSVGRRALLNVTSGKRSTANRAVIAITTKGGCHRRRECRRRSVRRRPSSRADFLVHRSKISRVLFQEHGRTPRQVSARRRR